MNWRDILKGTAWLGFFAFMFWLGMVLARPISDIIWPPVRPDYLTWDVVLR